MKDSRLVQEASEGGAGAFEELMRRYAPVIAGFLRGRLRVAAEAEDLMQEIFLAAFEQLPKLKHHDRFAPWLIRIAKYKLADHYRQKQRERRWFLFPARVEADGDTPESQVRDPAWGPRERSIEAETLAAVEYAMRRLNDTQRIVVYLRLWEGLSNPEIGERIGMAEGTVRVRLHRALKVIRGGLERRGIELAMEKIVESTQPE